MSSRRTVFGIVLTLMIAGPLTAQSDFLQAPSGAWRVEGTSITTLYGPGKNVRPTSTFETDWTVIVASDGILCDTRSDRNREVFLLPDPAGEGFRYWFYDGGGSVIYSRGFPNPGILLQMPGVVLPADVHSFFRRVQVLRDDPDSRVNQTSDEIRVSNRYGSETSEFALKFDDAGHLVEIRDTAAEVDKPLVLLARWGDLQYNLDSAFASDWTYEAFRTSPSDGSVWMSVSGHATKCDSLAADTKAAHYVDSLVAGMTEVPRGQQIKSDKPDLPYRISAFLSDHTTAFQPKSSLPDSAPHRRAENIGPSGNEQPKRVTPLRFVLGAVGTLLLLIGALAHLKGRRIRR